MPYFLQWSCLFSEASSGSEARRCTIPFIAIYSPERAPVASLRGSSTTFPSSRTSASALLVTFPVLHAAASFTFFFRTHMRFYFWGDLGVMYFFTGKGRERKKKKEHVYATGCLRVPLMSIHTSLSLNLLLLSLIKRCVERITCHFRSAMLRIVYLCKDLPCALTRDGWWQQT